ncbi:MAG: 50S ribosomal protein L10 [Phycisphaerae bacterium]|nr:50S ribosomal protein L10 [Phycisphaerae bacterium]
MSKPVKDLVVAEYRRRFGGVEGAVVVQIRGLDALGTAKLRGDLRKKAMRISVVKNTLARKAFEGTALSALHPALAGPSAIVYGGQSVVDVAREIVDRAKKVKEIELKAACLDGEFYGGVDGVTKLSTMPTREEALCQVVTLFLSPAKKLVAAALGPGGRVMGVVKEIQTRLERGEAIARTSG